MNVTIKKFLLTRDKFMPELHLRQPRFTYSACRLFMKHRKRVKKFKEIHDLKHISKNQPVCADGKNAPKKLLQLKF